MKRLLLFLLLSGCTVIIPARFTTTDLYEENKDSFSDNHKIKFIEVTAQELIDSYAKEIILFANWCGQSNYYILNLTQEEKQGVKFVSSNYAIESLEKNFALDTIYILSNKHYGSLQNDKIMQFGREILKEENTLKGVPQRFILTDNGYKRVSLK